MLKTSVQAIEKSIPAPLQSGKDPKTVWATLLVLGWLAKKFAKEVAEWSLLERKVRVKNIFLENEKYSLFTRHCVQFS